MPSGCSVNCAWCQKPGSKLFPLTTGNVVKAFCSELCFSLCRRASFKQSKKCEWCKHVRHTVNYVDFQDGDHQLQFCSEKCLNQFKMNLFCKETSEHLPKMQTKCENNDSSSSEHDNQILITPDLWLSEKNNNDQKSKESRDKDITDRDKYHAIRYEHKMTVRKHSSESGGFDRHNVQEKHVRDKHQRTSSREKASSQIHKTDRQPVSPNPREPMVPPQFMNNGVMPSMAHWFPQGQYMNAFSPGMSPFGPMHPMMYGGFFSPPQPGVFPPHGFHQTERSSSGQLLSPMSDRQSASSTPVGPRISTPSQSITPGPSSGPRKPIGMLGQQRYHGDSSTPSGPVFPPGFHGQYPMSMGLSSGIPPVTVMVPFPIPLPIPIPVPIPVPMEMEQIMKFLNKSSDSCVSGGEDSPNKNTKKNSNAAGSKRNSVPQHMFTVRSCKSESGHIDSSKDDNSYYSRYQDRSCSRNSCPDLPLVDRCRSISSHSDSALKRMRSRSPDEDVISPKRAHLIKYQQEDVCEKAIDLSKDSGLDSDRDTSYLGKENLREPRAFQSEAKEAKVDGVTQPRIHIVPTRNDPPLSQQLPLPPAESSYNFRRGLILDNPNVSKKARSPSPERRYVRSHPQDLIESVRRRHMRSRIRTK